MGITGNGAEKAWSELFILEWMKAVDFGQSKICQGCGRLERGSELLQGALNAPPSAESSTKLLGTACWDPGLKEPGRKKTVCRLSYFESVTLFSRNTGTSCSCIRHFNVPLKLIWLKTNKTQTYHLNFRKWISPKSWYSQSILLLLINPPPTN